MKSEPSRHQSEASDPLLSGTEEDAAPFSIRLFGSLEITIHGRTAAALPRPAQGLLALLVLQRGGAERVSLAGTLWPEAPPARALFYLRRTLSTLRTALGSS